MSVKEALVGTWKLLVTSEADGVVGGGGLTASATPPYGRLVAQYQSFRLPTADDVLSGNVFFLETNEVDLPLPLTPLPLTPSPSPRPTPAPKPKPTPAPTPTPNPNPNPNPSQVAVDVKEGVSSTATAKGGFSVKPSEGG